MATLCYEDAPNEPVARIQGNKEAFDLVLRLGLGLIFSVGSIFQLQQFGCATA